MQLRPCGTSIRRTLLCVNADTYRCSSGPVADTSRSSTPLCSADTSRCSSGPVADTSRSSTPLCSADTSRCSSGPVADISRSSTLQYINDKWLSKRSESFDNYVFFDIEAKRTRSIVGKFISKRSEHVYIKEFKNRSEANTFDSLNIYFEAKRTWKDFTHLLIYCTAYTL